VTSRSYALVCALLVLAIALPFRGAAEQPPSPGKPAASYDVGSLHIDEYGSGDETPLIFIPALFCGPWEWYGEIARFAPDHKVYAIALPGLAGKSAIAADSLIATTTGDFWRFLGEKNVVDAVVIGHSLGGTLALMLAEQHPERLQAIVAVDGGLITSPGIDPNDARARTAQVEEIARSVARIPPAQFGSALQQYILPPLITSPSDLTSVAQLGAKTDPLAAAQWMREALVAALRPGFARVTIPFLEIMPFDPQSDPKADPRYTTAADKLKVYEDFLQGAPLGQVMSIAPSRHFIPYDQPLELHAALASFIATLPTPTVSPSP